MTPDSYWYLATPYTHYELGHEAAFRMASEQAALLMTAGIPIFCPISHSHPIADFGKLDKVDPDFWRRMDKPMIAAAHGLIYVLASGYLRSSGMHNELVEMLRSGKPVVFMEPGKVPEELLSGWPKYPKPASREAVNMPSQLQQHRPSPPLPALDVAPAFGSVPPFARSV